MEQEKKKSEKMAGKKRIMLLYHFDGSEMIISVKEIERRMRRARIINPDAEFLLKIVNHRA